MIRAIKLLSLVCLVTSLVLFVSSAQALNLSDLVSQSTGGNGGVVINSTLSSSDLDTLGSISFSHIQNGSSNQPPNAENGNFGVVTFGDTNAKLQIAVSNGNLYSRFFNGSVWFDWTAGGGSASSVTGQGITVNGNLLTSVDYDNLNGNTMYFVKNGSTNEPTNADDHETYNVVTLGDNNLKVQTAYANGDSIYSRSFDGTTWSPWSTVHDNGQTIISTDNVASTINYNFVDSNSLISALNGSTNEPPHVDGKDFDLVTLGDADYQFQIAANNGMSFTRAFNGSAWSNWLIGSVNGSINVGGDTFNALDVDNTPISPDYDVLTVNTMRYALNGSTNEPPNIDNGDFTVITYGDGTAKVQLATSKTKKYTRVFDNASWGTWKNDGDATIYSDYAVQQIEQVNGSLSYIGRLRYDGNPNWLITRSRTADFSYATTNGNAAHTTFSAAWTNRASLTFKDQIGGGSVVP